jgi:uncharacterized membrane protein YeaQ/YmgE (transglycosylase-associated protein family)
LAAFALRVLPFPSQPRDTVRTGPDHRRRFVVGYCSEKRVQSEQPSQTGCKQDPHMSVIMLLSLSVLVGWLATLILHSDIGNVSLPDFAIGVIGAGIAGALLAPVLGIPMIGEYGFTLLGTLTSWVGAMSVLAVTNLMRRGQLRCGPATRKLSAQSNRSECAPSVRS